MMRGRKPSRTACLVTENAPEMTACEAMIVATVARTTIGKRLQCGSSRKKGFEIVGRVVDDQRSLAEVVEGQGREHDGEPGP